MEKKVYIQPMASVVDVDMETMLAASQITVVGGYADRELSNSRRDDWDDLWD